MKRDKLATAIAAAVLALGAATAHAQTTPSGKPARPADSTANLPSDSGSQTTLPSGAVTGAGQPQGTTVQRDVGAPGGLERRARRDARQQARGATTTSGAAAGREGGDADAARSERRTRARQEKG